MASHFFGDCLRMTTWGESHGPAIGVVIDGCPAGLALCVDEIQQALNQRRPGQTEFVTARQESDEVQLLSGVYRGFTTGTPISLLIHNQDVQSQTDEQQEHILRPSHAHYSYLSKFGVMDTRGGGRSSARETACRVAASVVAKKILETVGVDTCAYLQQVDEFNCDPCSVYDATLKHKIDSDIIFCPDKTVSLKIQSLLMQIRKEGDSIGGVVGFATTPLPVGLGEPVYSKLEAVLASALMGLPASKGFELGDGFLLAHQRGSKSNDLFTFENNQVKTRTNHGGGTLGGISYGMPLWGRVVFKAASRLGISQESITLTGQPAIYPGYLSPRHDPCVAVRAVPVVNAMLAFVLADFVLRDRLSRIFR